MKNGGQAEYVLGLDIGVSSIGWAVLRTCDGNPCGLQATGVRIFDAGVDETKFAQGGGEPPNAERRRARAARRLGERRSRRMRKLLHILQRSGMLPAGVAKDILPALDQELIPRFEKECDGSPVLIHHLLPYWLRARALDQKLEPYELGRALYHLAQRRGYLSNRKAARKKDDKKGKVEPAINELQAKIQQAGARTLGEYFASLDPREQRIRTRYTARRMYEQEFEQIWAAQSAYRPDVLTDELKADIRGAIFYQRPLRKQKYLIGECELEPGHKRAPWGLIIAQRFRLLQRVNDTKIVRAGRERDLTQEERSILLEKLDDRKEGKFDQVKKWLKLSDDDSFNWERGGETRFIGNKTNASLGRIFGKKRWMQLSAEERDQVVEDVRSIEREKTLKKRGTRVWGLDAEAAEKLARLELEPGYCHHSRKALGRLVPLMETGKRYMKAVEELYPERRQATEPVELLPPLRDTNIDVRNPAVHRVLTQLRRTVNAIIRRYGKPKQVRIELARDLRSSKEQRQETWKRNRQNEKERKDAAAKILAETGDENPRRADVEKVLLAEECQWTCPYTGRTISMTSLFGAHPQFDVEHIIPFSRRLDNSFLNKTLCEVRENREKKRNHTPWEAYGHDEQRWHEIMQRVKRFRGSAARQKVRRFLMQEIEDIDDVAERQLNDTRYASRLAMEYMGLLYGGVVDANHKRRVQAGRGGVTWMLRNIYGLNTILGDGGVKTRDDHRHHAVDAIAIALTNAAAVKNISRALADRYKDGRVRLGIVPLPWADFLTDVDQSIMSINVSHAVNRKVRGALHEETFYGPGPQKDTNGQPTYFHVRKPISSLSKAEVEAIVDPRVRQAVRQKLGEADPKTAFRAEDSHPTLPNRHGAPIPIHKVRIRKNVSAMPVGDETRRRYVMPGANHHMEIVEVTDAKGRKKWKGRLVSLFEAARRLRHKEPVVQRDAPGERFLFSLAPGELIELDGNDESRGLFIVRSVWGNRIAYARANDARKKKDIKAAKEWHQPVTDSLRGLHCRKVTVTPLGEVRYAND
ncbi:MAG: type II CRISPR RNA-guided endonuclease Cas9 [Planctomycetes bacterium]|nr:type II CRISPR RNA-guided endonuclease Cas9 [Planctomycetota bacterium]